MEKSSSAITIAVPGLLEVLLETLTEQSTAKILIQIRFRFKIPPIENGLLEFFSIFCGLMNHSNRPEFSRNFFSIISAIDGKKAVAPSVETDF